MNYQVLARKFRPQNFKEMVGQEHVVQALVNGLDNERIHHAYLFTGTRGVGKTTLARILAKSLNCEKGVSGHPCGECGHCQEIRKGEFLDLIEVDAASRTGVDDTRELLENVQYAPNKGRYKIYLIDEVHMFSKSSFNALLKTLEEPPEHVKFLLATTEQDKLPITVLSRCLQFNLKRLTQAQISGHLESLLKIEEIVYEDHALSRIARAADGSMRDALSLLDQSLAFGAGKISDLEVASMLGAIEQNHVQEILQRILDGDKDKLFAKVLDIESLSISYQQLLQDLSLLLHEISIFKVFGQVSSEIAFDSAVIKDFAQQITDEQLQLFYQISNIGREQMALAPSNKVGFEMTVLRLYNFKLPDMNLDPPSEQNQDSLKKKPEIVSASQNSSQQQASEYQTKPVEKHAIQSSDRESVDLTVSLPDLCAANWPEVFAKLPLKGTARELARNINVLENADKRIIFGVSAEAQVFLTEGAKKALNEILISEPQEYTLQFKIVDDLETLAKQQTLVEAQAQAQKNDQTSSDPLINELQDVFGAKIISQD